MSRVSRTRARLAGQRVETYFFKAFVIPALSTPEPDEFSPNRCSYWSKGAGFRLRVMIGPGLLRQVRRTGSTNPSHKGQKLCPQGRRSNCAMSWLQWSLTRTDMIRCPFAPRIVPASSFASKAASLALCIPLILDTFARSSSSGSFGTLISHGTRSESMQNSTPGSTATPIAPTTVSSLPLSSNTISMGVSVVQSPGTPASRTQHP